MLWPYAGGGCRADNRAQCCRRHPSASSAPATPHSRLQLSGLSGHRPASVRATGCTGVPGLIGPLPLYLRLPPAITLTPSIHVHLTLPLSVLQPPAPKSTESPAPPAVWLPRADTSRHLLPASAGCFTSFIYEEGKNEMYVTKCPPL